METSISAKIFSEIYEKRTWGTNVDKRGSSGPGSALEYVQEYITFVKQFVEENNVASVVDVGCGDWQFARHMNWEGIEYTGIDCVESVVAFNKEKFAKDNIKFLHLDLVDLDLLPKADLYLVKDVLQHLSNDIVLAFLDHLVHQTDKARWIIVTNCCHQRYDNQDTAVGSTRPLHSKFLPLRAFNAIPQRQFRTKEISLLHGGLVRSSRSELSMLGKAEHPRA
jgi:SAM-dependent methyltransferase